MNFTFALFSYWIMICTHFCLAASQETENEEKCQNGGIYREESESCFCGEGFSGKHCEISECGKYGKPILGDTGLFNLQTGSRCVCFKGWKGKNCQIPPCKQGKAVKFTNENGQEIYKCDCKPGYSGQLCDLICINGRLKWTQKLFILRKQICECFENWEGKSCDLPKCYNKGSRNGDVCECQGNYALPHCKSCKPDYFGNYCELKREKADVSPNTQLIVAIVVPIIVCLLLVFAGLLIRHFGRGILFGRFPSHLSEREVSLMNPILPSAPPQPSSSIQQERGQTPSLETPPPPYFEVVTTTDDPPNYKEIESKA